MSCDGPAAGGSARRRVQHRLALQADHVEVLGQDPVLDHERLAGDHVLGGDGGRGWRNWPASDRRP